jgi:uncharacterized repeat protein (TIGR01451 family)/MYXO-CTERM domain-containing protein
MKRGHTRTLVASSALIALTVATSSTAQGTGGPIYIADPGNHRIVRVNDITGDGWRVLHQNRTGTDQLASPDSIAFGPDGKMYITDQTRVVRVDDFTGNGWVSFGSQGNGVNQFTGLAGITVDARGHIYVADGANHRIASFDDMSGTNWQTCCSTSPPMLYVEDIAVDDTTGQIFYTDLNNDRIVRVDTMAGVNLKYFGTFGSGTGQFTSPRGIFVRGGKVYVVDESNRRIVQMNTSLDGTGWATVSTNSSGTESFNGPRYVFVDSAGHLFVTDYRQNRVVELDGFGGATWTALGSMGSGVDQFSAPEGVVLGPASTGSARADLSLSLQVDPSAADAGQPVTYTLVANNHGPDTATAATLIDLLPVGVTVQSSSGGTVGSDRVTWSLGDLPSGNPSASLGLTVDSPTVVDCKQPIMDVAAVSSTTTDPDPSNNYALVAVRPLPAATEDCSGTVDTDCNGLVGCADPACASASTCTSTPPSGATYVGAGTVPGGPVSSPPRGKAAPPPPPARPTPDPDQPPPTGPSQQQPCARADTRAPLPSYCCDPLPPPAGSTSPSQADWDNNCHAVDPNFLEATPPTNAMGYGLTTDGGTIAYTIHYENIGGAAAHGVGIVSVLDPDLDAQTLVVGGGGTFDSTSRTLSWLDPVLPPQVPRSVTFSAKVRADAPPRTRVWAQATVIFPDAFPPSRTDSNYLVHVVPYPDQPLVPALAVYRCARVSGTSDQWTAILENRGFGFAYDVTATIKSAPTAVTVTHGTTSFADVHDPTPDKLASVVPLASTASRTPVSFTSPISSDPCPTMTWEIAYSTSGGQRLVADVQAADDVNGNGIADYLETDGGVDAGPGGGPDAGPGGGGGNGSSGCGCASGPDALVAPVLLALLVLVQLGRRRAP